MASNGSLVATPTARGYWFRPSLWAGPREVVGPVSKGMMGELDTQSTVVPGSPAHLMPHPHQPEAPPLPHSPSQLAPATCCRPRQVAQHRALRQGAARQQEQAREPREGEGRVCGGAGPGDDVICSACPRPRPHHLLPLALLKHHQTTPPMMPHPLTHPMMLSPKSRPQ